MGFRRIEHDFSDLNDLLNSLNSCKPESVHFVTCRKQGREIEAVVLHRVGFLAYPCPKQGQDFKPSAAPLYPNMGQVPPPPRAPEAKKSLSFDSNPSCEINNLKLVMASYRNNSLYSDENTRISRFFPEIFRPFLLLVKVPITPKFFLARNKSLYRTKQDSAKISSFG